jgi:DNA-directed RNA polymerase subunit RPC12/RpoP
VTTANNIGPDAPSPALATAKIMRLRYPGKCATCGQGLERGTTAEWHQATKTLTCPTCLETRLAEATLRVVGAG